MDLKQEGDNQEAIKYLKLVVSNGKTKNMFQKLFIN